MAWWDFHSKHPLARVIMLAMKLLALLLTLIPVVHATNVTSLWAEGLWVGSASYELTGQSTANVTITGGLANLQIEGLGLSSPMALTFVVINGQVHNGPILAPVTFATTYAGTAPDIWGWAPSSFAQTGITWPSLSTEFIYGLHGNGSSTFALANPNFAPGDVGVLISGISRIPEPSYAWMLFGILVGLAVWKSLRQES